MDRMRALFLPGSIFIAASLMAQTGTTMQAPPSVSTDQPTNALGRFLTRYKYTDVEPINLTNSTRLDALLRGGRLYLALQDVIALALENNLDIEIQRYGPRLADADLQRAQAGGLIRGVPTSLNNASTAATSALGGGNVLGSASGAANTGTSTGGTTGGAVFSTSGAAIPVFEPTAFASYNFAHRTQINANSFTTGTTSSVTNTNAPNIGFQKAFTSGTTAVFGWNTTHVRSNQPRAEINPFTTGNVNIQITQRLLQGFGTAVNNRNIRIARLGLKTTDLVFRQQVIQTVANVINLYWDLVSFNEDVRVKKQALALAEKLLSDNRKQVEIGTLAPIEIVRAEAEVARTQQDLTNSETRVLQQETLIKNAISRTGVASPAVSEARLVPTDSIKIPENEKIQPMQDLVRTAFESRPDLEQTRVAIEQSKIGIAGDKSALKPSLDLTAAATNNGLAGDINDIPIPGVAPGTPRVANGSLLGAYGTVLRQIFGRNYPDYSVGFQLNIPLTNRQARADLANDLLRLRQQELRAQQLINSIRVDVQNALIGLQQARAAYQAAYKSRIFAEQTLDAEQKKYALGASTIFLVIQAQRDLATAQGTEVTSLSAYSRARTQLDVAMGTTIETNNIVFEEAKRGVVTKAPTTVPGIDPGK